MPFERSSCVRRDERLRSRIFCPRTFRPEVAEFCSHCTTMHPQQADVVRPTRRDRCAKHYSYTSPECDTPSECRFRTPTKHTNDVRDRSEDSTNNNGGAVWGHCQQKRPATCTATRRLDLPSANDTPGQEALTESLHNLRRQRTTPHSYPLRRASAYSSRSPSERFGTWCTLPSVRQYLTPCWSSTSSSTTCSSAAGLPSAISSCSA